MSTIKDKPSYRMLTHERAVPTSKREIIITISATLVIFLAISMLFILYLKAYTTNRGYWVIEKKWDVLKNLESPVDWLVLGDSSCNQAIVIDVFMRELGESALNLCTVGPLTAVDDLWLLEAYMDRFGPPDNLLIMHTYDSLTYDVTPILLGKIPQKLYFWKESSVQPTLTIRDHVNYWLSRYFPVYTDFKTIQNIILSPKTWFRSNFFMDDRGYMPSNYADSENVEQDSNRHLDFSLENSPLKISPINESAISSMIDLSEKNGTEIFFSGSPLYEGLYDNNIFSRNYHEIFDQINVYSTRSEKFFYLERVSTFPKSVMENADHITSLAADGFTRRVAKDIKELIRKQ